MKIKLTREQKTGLFAIIILFSIYLVINYLKGKDLFSNRNTYYTVFYDIDGLTATGPIYLRGLKVGTIESINYSHTTDKFVVMLKVGGKYNLPKNSVAEIYSTDLLGSKALRINMGDKSEILKNRDTLASATDPGLINMLADQLIPIKESISGLIETMNTTLLNVNEILSPKARQDLAASLESLSKTLKGAEGVVSNIDKSGPEITSIIANLNQLTLELGSSSKKLNMGLDNVVQITDSLKSADLTGTITSLKGVLEQIKNPDGTIGKLLYTDSVHTSIDRLIRDLDTLVKNITENPKKYIKISVF
jgi:phospholipid/cholesterol/gamma-HCH transport system substrate-binding protein